MKILGVNGSPRKDGNTEILLDKALEGAKSQGAEIEKIVLNDLNFKPCQNCGGCGKTGSCVLKDDGERVYKSFDGADKVVMASPIFFGSLSAQTKMMIDRFQSRWVLKYRLKRPPLAEKPRKGIFLAVSAMDAQEFFENAASIIKIFYKTMNIEYAGELFCPGVDRKGAIMVKQDVLEKAFEMGKGLARS